MEKFGYLQGKGNRDMVGKRKHHQKWFLLPIIFHPPIQIQKQPGIAMYHGKRFLCAKFVAKSEMVSEMWMGNCVVADRQMDIYFSPGLYYTL